jgi:methanogenic corrinoid protein MtbC1
MEQFEGFSVYVLGSVAAVETFINDVKGGDA